MQLRIRTHNCWAITGGVLAYGLDYDRDFYAHKEADNIDAPACVPAGSTIKHVSSLDGRTNVLPSIIWCRG